MRLCVTEVRARLRVPFSAAHGTLSERPLALVTLCDASSGLRGHGEAAPLEGYDGVGIGEVLTAIDACRELLANADLTAVADPTARAALLGRCARRAGLAQALAAIDLALHDLAGRAAGVPVCELLGAVPGSQATVACASGPGAISVNHTVAVNHTIAALNPEAAGSEAARALQAGFSTVKVKVGMGATADIERVAAVRAAGGERLAIRLDANGAWGLQAARRALLELAPYGIELCEEPVHGAALIERLAARVPVALALDESAAQAEALQRRCAEAICLKISRCGGIAGVLGQAKRALQLGYEVYLASTLDGPLGIAAALHAAALLAVRLPCGLATLSLFDGPHDPLAARDGRIALPAGPGLGGDVLLDFYAERRG